MNNVCEISIDGNEYYLPCDRVQHLSYIDGYLVNISSSTLTMRSSFSPNTTYPYISCSSMGVCNLRTSQTSQNNPITSDFVNKSDFIKSSNLDYLIFFTLFITLGVRLIWKH